MKRYEQNVLFFLIFASLVAIGGNWEFCRHWVDMLLYSPPLYLPPIGNSAMADQLCKSHRKVLYGVFSMAHKAETRATLRRQAQCDLNNDVHSTIFIVGKPKTEQEHEVIARESQAHGDVFVLTCSENMNEGKSYAYFKEASQQLPCFDFYAKVDDDTAFVPNKLSRRLDSIQNNASLYIGRSPVNEDTALYLYILKTIQFSFRDMSWLFKFRTYNAGMLYVLNSQAVRQWVALAPTQLYGDEDYRTSYYMTLIGATVVDLSTSFHDYIKYKTSPFKNHWRLGITHDSLAVHQCKSTQDLSDAFEAVCSA